MMHLHPSPSGRVLGAANRPSSIHGLVIKQGLWGYQVEPRRLYLPPVRLWCDGYLCAVLSVDMVRFLRFGSMGVFVVAMDVWCVYCFRGRSDALNSTGYDRVLSQRMK